MKDKEMIEEIAKTVYENVYLEGHFTKGTSKAIAKFIMEQGYRKLSEDSVVLSKVEKEKLLKEMYEQGRFDALADLEKDGKVVLSREEYGSKLQDAYDNGVKFGEEWGSKETAEKIINYLQKDGWGGINYLEIYQEDLDEIAKQFGVEIKE